MGQTLTNGIYLPDEGEVRCYDGLAANWTTLDAVVGGYRAHIANENIHITSAERNKWDNGVTQAYVLRYANTSLTALGTVAFSALDNTDNVKIGDKVLDSEGKLFALTAVDTANSTATLSALLIDLSKDSDLSNYYTKPETDTLLSNKANDSDVVHKSGNETISGNKTFSSNVNVYNSDPTATTPNLYLKNSKIEISSQGNTSGDQNLTFLDKNNTAYANVKGAIQSNGSAVKIRAIAKDSSDNSVVNELQLLAYTNGNKAIFPTYSNEIDLGVSNYKWKSFNGVEPSSLGMPSDRSARIDISSYITNLGNGNNNIYTVPANGYIWLHFTSINSALCYSQTPGGLTNYAQTFARYSGEGQLYAFFPVRNGDNFVVQIYTSSTAVVQNAYFIPCQGNV